ncbi:MAG: VWA domain-containing protein [Gemmatimonadetes bacterium]|nr:VWA domain-containing protein [Gemmatimonadota bacterium]
MGFLVPAFLGALVALALPLWLHLRRRNRRTPVRFPSLQFLRALPIQVTRRRRVADLPLLLLRALAVAAVVLAFARPVMRPGAGVTAGASARDVVLLVDRSLSMGTPGTWARTRDSARAVVASLAAGDRIAVVAFDDAVEVVAPLAPDRDAARRALDALAPRQRGTAMAGAVRAARALLEPAPGGAVGARREVVLVSDLQGTGARGVEGVSLPAAVTWRAIATGPAAVRNRWVGGVRTRRARPDGRSLLAVQARVRAMATPGREVARERLTATLLVNGRAAASAPVTLAAGADAAVAFPAVAVPEEPVLVQVALPPDDLPGDDTVRVVVPRDLAVPVTLLSAAPDEETAFLRQALAQVDGPRLRVERQTRLGAPPQDAAGPPPVVLAWDLFPDADAMAAWRAQGAGFVLLAGARVGARRGAGSPWPVAMQGMADRTADRGGHLAGWRAEHPLFAPFREVPQALGEPRAWRYPRLDAAPGAEVLARFDDGLPAIVREPAPTEAPEAETPGRGRAATNARYVVAIPLDATRGEWPLHPAFVPLVQQLAHEASGAAGGGDAHVTGARWRVPDGVPDPVVRAPGGALLRPGTVRDGVTGGGISLADAGVYQLFAGRAAGIPVQQLAVNVPEGESRLEALPPVAVQPGLDAGGERTASRDSAVRTPAAQDASPEAWERRQTGWRWLLLLAVLLLLGETVMATRGRRAVVQDVMLPRAPERRAAPPAA